jgi:hypothetical protein
MRKLMSLMTLALLLSMSAATESVFAAAPPTNPNGFPSGPHYNLNLIGKKPDFDGCTVPLDPVTNLPLYGNVVFVPEISQGDIWLKSGSGRKTTVATLQVTDPCVTAFDGDAAEVQLPALPDGYWVYARALGKLTDNPSMKIAPELITVSSTDDILLYLGYVTANGFANAAGTTVYRAKGKHPAVPISDLFEWQGDVCYASDPATTFGMTGYEPKDVCLLDANGDGWDDIVGYPVDGVCAEGVLASLYCKWYDTTWVFNVADFVNYLWGVDNNGAKLVQIRFYPR